LPDTMPDPLYQSPTIDPSEPNVAPHVIVLGNEKGGAGKTTVAMHVVAALLEAGKSVGTLDLDVRQQSFSRYIANRQMWVGRRDMAMPEHITLQAGSHNNLDTRQQQESESFVQALGHLRANHDFVVVDCPGSDSYLSRLGHASADTLITPMNESFVDVDLLATLDPNTLEISGPSIYAEMVWSCRQARVQANGAAIDWVVLRNRTSHIHAKNRKRVEATLEALATRLAFRQIDGLSERVVFREMFPAGLTLLDLTSEEANASLTMSHVAARAEVKALLNGLKLPGLAMPEAS
jgi:chromosome partitioning protein